MQYQAIVTNNIYNPDQIKLTTQGLASCGHEIKNITSINYLNIKCCSCHENTLEITENIASNRSVVLAPGTCIDPCLKHVDCHLSAIKSGLQLMNFDSTCYNDQLLLSMPGTKVYSSTSDFIYKKIDICNNVSCSNSKR